MNEQTHPYTEYEDTPMWKVVDRAIRDLVGNQDITETTRHEYIVGYIVRELDRKLA